MLPCRGGALQVLAGCPLLVLASTIVVDAGSFRVWDSRIQRLLLGVSYRMLNYEDWQRKWPYPRGKLLQTQDAILLLYGSRPSDN